MGPLFWLLLVAAPLAAQELRVYSEFQRPDPFGDVAVPDRGAPPREILSPAVARNAWATFYIALTLPEAMPAFVHIQQNPEVVEAAVYRTEFVKTARGWVPDGLRKSSPNVPVMLPEAGNLIPQQTTAVLLLDLWVPAKAQSGRMRLQIDVHTDNRWLTYPLEIRVMSWTAPGTHTGSGPLPPVASRADTSLLSVLRQEFCGKRAGGRDVPGLTIRRLLRRNAQQDAALAHAVGIDLVKQTGPRFCQETPPLAEWWLPFRLGLYRGFMSVPRN